MNETIDNDLPRGTQALARDACNAHTKWLAVALVVLTLIAYFPALRGGFIWDDDAHVTPPELRSLDGLRRIWFEPGATQQYYPVLYTAFWIEYKLWDGAPLDYHVTNVALHIGASFLLLSLLRRLRLPGAYFATLIFALHPVQVESVAWISEQKNTLSAVFYLSAVMIYLRFDETRNRRSYAAAAILFLLALLCKTVTATLPPALLVILWWRRGRIAWTRDVRPLLPMFAAGVGAGIFTAWIERHLAGAEGAEFQLASVERLLLAGRVPWFYLSKLVWPVNLAFIYSRWQISESVWWQYLFPVAAALSLAALFSLRHKWRAPLAGALFFLGTLFPVLGFFNVYPFRYSFVADHFQYLASLGVIVPFAAWTQRQLDAARSWRRHVGMILAVILVGVLTVLGARQSATYANAETLYRATIARNPGCWMAYNNLGGLLLERGRLDDAITNLEQGLRFRPDDAGVRNNLGTAFLRERRFIEAANQYRESVRLNPDYTEAHYNLGNALCELNQLEDATAQYRETIRLDPDYSDAHYNLANTLMRQQQTTEATVHYQLAVRLRPEDVETRYTLANVLAQQGDLAGAAINYQRVVQIKPDFVAAHYNLANTLLHLGRTNEAITQYRESVGLKPDLVAAQFNLATVLLATGNAQESINHYQQVIALQPDLGQAHYKLGVAWARLGRFENATNCCDQALHLNPDFPEALADCAWLLATHDGTTPQDARRAVEFAARACQLTANKEPAYVAVLAAAYASTGDFTNAVATAGIALAASVNSGQAGIRRPLANQLDLYRAGQPYRITLPAALPSDW